MVEKSPKHTQTKKREMDEENKIIQQNVDYIAKNLLFFQKQTNHIEFL